MNLTHLVLYSFLEGASVAGIPGAIEIGETEILPTTDNSNSGRIQAQLAVLGQQATIQSISFYTVSAAGNIRMAIYDATGASGGPGALKAETADTVAAGTNTWHVVPVVSPVLLDPGDYWLAWQVSSNSHNHKFSATGGTDKKDNGFSYAAFPATFTIDATGTARWSISAQFTVANVNLHTLILLGAG